MELGSGENAGRGREIPESRKKRRRRGIVRDDTERQKSRTERRAERQNGKGRGARGGAGGSPPLSPNDLGQPWRGAGAGPDAAQTPGPDTSGGTRGPCLAGSGVAPRVRSAGSGLRTLCGVRREAGALSAVLKTGRARGELWSGARRGAEPGLHGRQDKRRRGRAGGARGPLPRDSALAHLARRRAEVPGQRRSA